MDTQLKVKLKTAAKAAFPNTIPVLTSFLVLGAAYGILMQTKGYGVLWSAAMSMICFCGSMQFVAITLLTAAFNPVQAFLLSVMVNARHIFYGISMLQKFKGSGRLKPFLIFWLCDESFSIESCIKPPEGTEPKYFYFMISIMDYLYWITGTILGGVIGNLLKFDTAGLDFALTALFVVLFIQQVQTRRSAVFGFTGLLCSAAALALFGADNMVIPAMVIILILLVLGRKRLCG